MSEDWSRPIEKRSLDVNLSRDGVTVESLRPEEFAVRELRQSDVPPEHWPAIIKATRKRKNPKRPWYQRAVAWALRLLALS